MSEEQVTESQAADALRALAKPHVAEEDDVEVVQPAPEEAAAPEPEGEPESAPQEPEEAAAATDDVESLKSRLVELEGRNSQLSETLDAVKGRAAQASQWARDLALRKSDQINKAQRLLKQALSEDGVAKPEVEKLLSEMEAGFSEKSTLHRPQMRQADDDTVMAENDFLNDVSMNVKQAEEFRAWITGPDSTLTDRDRGIPDTYALLQTAYRKYGDWKRTQETTATKAALKTVRKAQTAAARAADARPKAPPPSAARLTEADKMSKMSPQQMIDTGAIAEAFKSLVER